MIGYGAGLFVTIGALIWTKEPQPALLFILPTMSCIYLIMAFLRKEFVHMLWYNEDVELGRFEIKIE